MNRPQTLGVSLRHWFATMTLKCRKWESAYAMWSSVAIVWERSRDTIPASSGECDVHALCEFKRQDKAKEKHMVGNCQRNTSPVRSLGGEGLRDDVKAFYACPHSQMAMMATLTDGTSMRFPGSNWRAHLCTGR